MTEFNHSSIQLRVDEHILDYLMFAATHTLIENAKSALADDQQFKNKVLAEMSLEMVDSFLTLFWALHPNHHCNIHLQFRLRLLKYVALLESRGSCLHLYPRGPHPQGAQDDKGLTTSISNHDEAPLATSSSCLTDNHDEQLVCKASVGPLSQRKPLASSSLLLDTLPHFMALSAAQLMLQGSHITEIWMKLAAGYMTHAVMEQYFARGEHGLQVIRRAFAWGFDEQSAAEEGSDECQINAMFFDEDNDMQVEGWNKTRNDHINAPGITMPSHLQMLIADEFSPRAFEQCLIEFLDNLLHGQPKPLLMQAGFGKIDGLSPEENRTLITRLGIA